jgi:hypothetical protein
MALSFLKKPFTAIIGKIDDVIWKKIIAGQIRHAATFLGGLFVAWGLTDSSSMDLVVGALVTLLGAIASGLQKKVTDAVQ